jgi:hypothetical protein
MGAAVRAGAIGPESAGGGELVNYLRFLPHDITAPVDARMASYPGYHMRATKLPGELLGWVKDPDLGAMDGERWFGWLPGNDAWPLGSAFTHGNGRVVAWAAPLETVFFRQGRPEAGAVLAASARWAARHAPPVVVEAPITVEATSWDRDDCILVAFANRSSNDLAAIGAGVAVGASTSSMSGAATGDTTLRAQFPRVILPVVDIEVTLPWEGRAPEVQTLSGRPASSSVAEGRLRVAIGRVDAWEAIRIPRP